MAGKETRRNSRYYWGGTPSTSHNDYWNGDILWITPSEIKDKYINQSNRTITESGVKNSSAKLLPVGTILLTTRATIGEMAILKQPGTTNQGFQNLIVCDGYLNEFIYYHERAIKRQCYKKAAGSTFLEISKKEVENICVSIPSLPEQEKIGSFLSKIDERIELEEKKLELFKERKRGWMQKLFNQEIRFKEEDGNNYPDWEEKKLGEIADIKAGRDLDKNKLVEEGFPVFGNALTDKGFLGFYSDYEFLDDAVTVTGRGDIGKAFYRQGKFNTVGRLISVCSKENSYFLAEAINRIKIFNESTGVPQLTALQLKEYSVPVPSLLEQKIADFLSKQDELISAQEKKVSLLNEQKKGLLQQMFV